MPQFIGLEAAAFELLRARVAWVTARETPVEVTYGFATTPSTSYPAGPTISGFLRFNAEQMRATEMAMQAWSDVANITFRRVNDPGSDYSNNATMLFRAYSTPSDASGRGSFPTTRNTSPGSIEGDVWINGTHPRSADPVFNRGVDLFTHEIGHSIGLSHPGDYGSNPTYANNAAFGEDTHQYTVMSYFNAINTNGWYSGGFIVGPQILDIIAVQLMYSANMTTRTGDTVYGFNSNADRAWLSQGFGEATRIFCAWDAGGIDTFDFSGFSSSQRLDLRAAAFSSTGELVNNVSIAVGVVIENAIGGAGFDTLTGNDAGNRLVGGGAGDTISGGGAADDLNGNTGADALHGEAGDDWLTGGQDNDALFGDDGDDVLLGSQGNDTCDGGAGADLLRGGQGGDLLYGQAGNDRLFGDGGDDTLTGGSGADTFHSGPGGGDDLILDFNAAEGDRVQLAAGTSYTLAQVGTDTVVRIEGGAHVILAGVSLATLPIDWIGAG